MEHAEYTVIRAGTAVTRKILDNLLSPDDSLKIIHIAGTNGKGSTAEFFTQILVAAGKKTGTFSSPAVYDFYDQFKINGKPLKKDTAEKYFEAASLAAEGLNATDFEIQTAGIIFCFEHEGCEYAVIECGMGGTCDATNAINKKELAVITSVSLEHTAYLGGTVKEICAHKAGIIKNCPAVVNAFQPHEEAKAYFEKLGCRFAGPITFTGVNTFEYSGTQYSLNAAGCLQAYNAATAIEGAKLLGLPKAAVRAGIENARPEGRIEKFSLSGRDYILDGAHNPAAFAPLREYLGKIPRRIALIFGCLKDKDIDGNLSALSGLTEEITAVKCPSVRASSAEDTARICGRHFKKVKTAESVCDALDTATADAVVVCGSFTLLKEAKEWIEKRQ